MKHLRSTISLLMITLLVSLSFTGCKEEKPTVIPYSNLSLENSYEEMIEVEGESTDTSDSFYEGTTYSYPKTYLGLDGDVSYNFDADNNLCSISWMYEASSKDDVINIYNNIKDELVKSYGDSGYSTGVSTNSGDVWHRDEGDIILSCVTTDSLSAISYSYLHPRVSSKHN